MDVEDRVPHGLLSDELDSAERRLLAVALKDHPAIATLVPKSRAAWAWPTFCFPTKSSYIGHMTVRPAIGAPVKCCS